jgi:hypothetical protein
MDDFATVRTEMQASIDSQTSKDRTAAERNSTFGFRNDRNSGSPEYHYGRQLSQLFDGLLNGSKRLAIYELRLSGTRLVC